MNNPVFNTLGGSNVDPVAQVMQQINVLKQQYSDPQTAIRMGNFTQQELNAAQAAVQQFMKQYLNK